MLLNSAVSKWVSGVVASSRCAPVKRTWLLNVVMSETTTSTMGGTKKDWVNEDLDMRNLPGLNAQQLAKIRDSDNFLRNKHMKIEAEMDSANRDAARRKRMIYRSKQRGWLEADLLLGAWAVNNVPGLSAKELDEYELVLKEETIDIYNYVSGKDALPPHLKNLNVMKQLQAYAKARTMASPESYARIKKEANLT